MFLHQLYLDILRFNLYKFIQEFLKTIKIIESTDSSLTHSYGRK